LPLGPLAANCYIVTDEKSGQSAVIDPGAYETALCEAVAKLEPGSVRYILLTHGHFDHILGVAQLKQATGAAVAVHRLDAPCLFDSRLSYAQRYRRGAQQEVRPDIMLEDGSRLFPGECGLTVLHTPGHSAGSVCYYCADDNVLFSGDTLFRGTVGRTDFEGGDYGQMLASLSRLLALDEGCAVYPGHDRPTTVGYERAHNPYVGRTR